MRRVLIIGLALASLSLGGAATGTSATQICLRMSAYCGAPVLSLSFGGSISPSKLPSGEYAPIAAHAFGKIETSTGNHPPALRELEVDVDKDVRIDLRSFPACGAARIAERRSRAAMQTCRKAFLGEGTAHVELGAPAGAPMELSSRLLLFNGGKRNGVTKLLVHAFLPLSTPTAIVTRIAVQKRDTSLHAVARIPVIAGGMGSLIDFDFDIGQAYDHPAKPGGYLEARCPDEVFKVNVKKILFKNEAQTPGEGASTQLKGSLAVPCTSRE